MTCRPLRRFFVPLLQEPDETDGDRKIDFHCHGLRFHGATTGWSFDVVFYSSEYELRIKHSLEDGQSEVLVTTLDSKAPAIDLRSFEIEFKSLPEASGQEASISILMDTNLGAFTANLGSLSLNQPGGKY